MIIIEEVLVSDRLFENSFHCDLQACKGACCVEGDEGAKLEETETAILDDIYEDVKEYLTPEGREVLETEGRYVLNEKGKLRTPLIQGKACAYVNYDNGIALCGIEKAYLDGKIDWQKPVSCHLYPVRITELHDHLALNYEEWEICDPACVLGDKKKLPLFRFVKDALIRKFGESFYEALEATANYIRKKGE